MVGLGAGTGAPIVKVYHEKSMILPDVSRVLACLYEKNVEFQTVKASYKDILRLQATRSVPVPFYDGPTFRQESRAICRYIAETYEQRGQPFLLGKDVLERASIEQWLRHEEHAFDPPSRALFCHLAFPLHDEDMSDIDREKRKLEEVLEVYEQRLGESEFLAGNKFTLADLVHLPNTYHIVESEFAYLYDSRKNVQRWWNTISARDSWQQVLRDMQSVEEQNQIEELEQEQLEQQWEWETEPQPTSGHRILRMDPRQQTGTESHTILVPPPSGSAMSSSLFTVQQEQQPLPAETTSNGETSPNRRKESNFFTTTEKTPASSKQKTPTTQEPPSSAQSTTSNFFTPATPPTTKMSLKTYKDKASSKDASSLTKTSQRSILPTNPGSPTSVQSTTSSFFTPPTTTTMPQRANTDKSTSKDASSPTRPSQGSSKQDPDKLHLSDFYKSSSHTDETEIITKPTPKGASLTSDRISAPRQTSEVVAPDKPSPASPKTPSGIDGPDFSETERKPTSVDTRPAAQRAAGISGPEAGERPSNQRSVVQTPYAQRPSEQAKKVTADQRAASQFPEHMAANDIQGETAPQVRYRDVKDSTKEAREPDEKRAASATTRELPSGSQIIPKQSKAPPTSLKASDLPPVQEEYEDTQGEDERFSTKRLRKMLEKSDPAALKSQSTDLQTPPIQEETPSIQKNPSYVQDRKGQAGNSSADGKNDGIPSNGTGDPGTRIPDTPTTVDATREISPPKRGMAPDGHGASATEPQKLPSINEQQPAPPLPRQSPTTAAQLSDQAPTSSSFADKRNVKPGTDEASQTATVAPDEQPGGRAPKNSVNKPISSKDGSSNSTSDDSSKPSRQFNDNEGNAPQTQRGG